MVGSWSTLSVSWKNQAKEFFKKSTLHGVRYIAETDRPIYERFIWLVLTTTGGVITMLIILSLWSKFQTNATITGLDTDFHNWDAPFPAVTICPQNPLNETRVIEFIQRTFPSPIEEEKLLYYKKFVTQVATLSYANMENISEFAGDKTLPQENLRDILPQVLMSCESIISECQWKDNPYDCCEGFLPIRTEHGFCYTFNCLRVDTELLSDRRKTAPQTSQFIYETDTKWSLVFNLNRPEKETVKVYLHSADDYPSFDLEPQLVWLGQIAKMFFSSKDTYTTDNARQLTIAQRKCIFEDERPLLTASKYSYVACMLQCRMQKTLQMCQCVPHFYAKIDGFPFCNLTGLSCLAQNMNEISRSLACPCELGCSNTVYEVEKLIDAVGREETLEVGFVSWPMVRYKREVLFGWVDLLVSFGGIAGLFLGFSLVSGIEIVYYFTLRAACMVQEADDDVTAPLPPPAPAAAKDKKATAADKNIFWLNDQLMMKQQMAMQSNNLNSSNNRSLRVKRKNNNDNSLYNIPYLN